MDSRQKEIGQELKFWIHLCDEYIDDHGELPPVHVLRILRGYINRLEYSHRGINGSEREILSKTIPQESDLMS